MQAQRTSLHLSQTDVAAKIGLRQEALSRSEHGERAFTGVELVQLAYLLNVSVEEILQKEPSAVAAFRAAHGGENSLTEVVERCQRLADEYLVAEALQNLMPV